MPNLSLLSDTSGGLSVSTNLIRTSHDLLKDGTMTCLQRKAVHACGGGHPEVQ